MVVCLLTQEIAERLEEKTGSHYKGEDASLRRPRIEEAGEGFGAGGGVGGGSTTATTATTTMRAVLYMKSVNWRGEHFFQAVMALMNVGAAYVQMVVR